MEAGHSNNPNPFLYGTYIDVCVHVFGGGKDEKPKKITMETNRNGILWNSVPGTLPYTEGAKLTQESPGAEAMGRLEWGW